MSPLLLSGTTVLLSQLHPAGSSDAGGCAQPQCYCWNWSWDDYTAGVPISLHPVPGESQERGAQRQPVLTKVSSHPPLTSCPPCLCRCAGSLPPRLVLRAGSPVSSAECRVSATVLLPSFCLAGNHLHLYPELPPVSSSSGCVATSQQTPEVHLPSLSPERDVHATIHSRMERHHARGGCCDGKGSPDTITSLNLKENYPGSLGWWGCQNKKHSLTEHRAARQE